jgi:hypothetical protein
MVVPMPITVCSYKNIGHAHIQCTVYMYLHKMLYVLLLLPICLQLHDFLLFFHNTVTVIPHPDLLSFYNTHFIGLE